MLAVLIAHIVRPFSHSKIDTNHSTKNIESTRYGDSKNDIKDKTEKTQKQTKNPR